MFIMHVYEIASRIISEIILKMGLHLPKLSSKFRCRFEV